MNCLPILWALAAPFTVVEATIPEMRAALEQKRVTSRELVQQMSTLFLPNQLQNTAIFVVFLAIVLLRPQGLFGTAARRT